MFKKLEEIKQLGAYGVTMYFGEDIGCDDLNIETNKRRILVIYTPVGCLGGQKVLWRGTVEEFLKFDFSSKKKILSNPPNMSDVEQSGYYIWGADLEPETEA